jgi:WD40 repeat protein
MDADEARVLPPLPGWVGSGSACFTSDGRYGINTRELYRDGNLACWKQTPDGFQPVWKRKIDPKLVAAYRTVHCFLPDDDHFAYTERRGRWDEGLTLVVASRTDMDDVTEGHFPNQSVGYHGASPDGRWLALGAGYGPSITVYRVDDLKAKPIRLTAKSRRHYTDLAFHPSGEFMAATSNDTTVTFFDTRTFAEMRTYTWKIGRLRSVAFSPDGALAAVGSDKGQVVVWDVDL